jgi:single stranded DNA-binding protein
MFNKGSFEGNMTRDPFFKQTDKNCLVKFSLACNNKRFQSDGTVKEFVEFAEFTAWGNLAKAIKDFYKKGDRVFVTEYHLGTNRWDDANGKTRYDLQATADWCVNLSRPFKRGVLEDAGDKDTPETLEAEDRVEVPEADIPF